MNIDITFDLGARVVVADHARPGRVVGMHVDRHGLVRYDVEYRDHRGALRSDWHNAQQLILVPLCTSSS